MKLQFGWCSFLAESPAQKIWPAVGAIGLLTAFAVPVVSVIWAFVRFIPGATWAFGPGPWWVFPLWCLLVGTTAPLFDVVSRRTQRKLGAWFAFRPGVLTEFCVEFILIALLLSIAVRPAAAAVGCALLVNVLAMLTEPLFEQGRKKGESRD